MTLTNPVNPPCYGFSLNLKSSVGCCLVQFNWYLLILTLQKARLYLWQWLAVALCNLHGSTFDNDYSATLQKKESIIQSQWHAAKNTPISYGYKVQFFQILVPPIVVAEHSNVRLTFIIINTCFNSFFLFPKKEVDPIEEH